MLAALAPKQVDVKMLHHSGQPITGTILVADDETANRELLEELLTTQGFKVIAVPDGAAALQELSRAQADLVLLDVMMPHLDGFTVCEQIKANPDTYLIPVILITALSDRQDRIEGIKVGADDFLSRPVDRTELLARVRSLLKLKQRTDELERAESVLFTLARSIEGKDPYTHGHCERLSDYSARLGEHLGHCGTGTRTAEVGRQAGIAGGRLRESTAHPGTSRQAVAQAAGRAGLANLRTCL
jgi:response regulator RpfG family c-di-GMP phosphodiesterase